MNTMASAQEVRQYLAYWFQLGKRVVIRNGQESLLPQPVFQGDRYSQAFENCWQILTSPESGDCYLDGTQETIAELLTSEWVINPCARCTMPIPVRDRAMFPASPCVYRNVQSYGCLTVAKALSIKSSAVT